MSKPASPIRVPNAPAFHTRAHVRRLALAECASPAALYERTAGPGAVLLESADLGAGSGRGSYLLPVPVLRLLVRGAEVGVRALSRRAEPLLDVLRERLGARPDGDDGLRIAAPRAARDPALDDEERLRSPSVLDVVREVLGLVADDGGREPPILVAGAFGYELVDHFEDLPPRPPDPLEEPDLDLVLGLDGVFLDHVRGHVTITTRALSGPGVAEADEERAARVRCEQWAADACAVGGPPQSAGGVSLEAPAFSADFSEAGFLAAVDELLGHIAAGDVFQAVLSRALTVPSTAPPVAVYRALRAQNPSPYMFFYDLERGSLLGASPEMCLRVRDGVATLSPIAGTAARGRGPDGELDADRDVRLAVSLLLDAKEQSEHAMLIDLARNDLARICKPGTREVVEPFGIERFSHVQHLVSRVRGRLRGGLDALDAYRACANMGTLTGAPKLRAMEILRGLEPTARGFYGGAVGYVTPRGDLDTCIVIRSLRHVEGVYVVRSGAGIVADSNPGAELLETMHKAQAPLAAIAMAEGEVAR